MPKEAKNPYCTYSTVEPHIYKIQRKKEESVSYRVNITVTNTLYAGKSLHEARTVLAEYKKGKKS